MQAASTITASADTTPKVTATCSLGRPHTMAIVTDVWFSHPDGALAATLVALESLEVESVREASTDPDRRVYFYRFDGHPVEAIRASVADDPSVRTARQPAALDEKRLFGVEFAPETTLLGPEVTAAGGYVLDARGRGGGIRGHGWYERWSLPDHESLREIWQDARSTGFDFEILGLQRHDGVDDGERGQLALTDEQRAALLAAYEAGYFAEPRETSLEALASDLEISPSAVSGRLKRGLSTLLEGTIAVDGRANEWSTEPNTTERPRPDSDDSASKPTKSREIDR